MSKNFITGVAVAAALSVVALFFVFNGSIDFAGDAFSPAGGDQTTLIVQDEVVGTGKEAVAGTIVTVHYTGKFENGTVFETSVGGQPVDFPLGVGYVIPGWEQGVLGMKEGGKRLLIIPPSLAYGAEGRDPIPPNSTLIFEIELVKVTESQ